MNDPLPVSTSPLPVRLRVEDYLLLDESGAFEAYARTELIAGEIVYMNAQHRPHVVVKSELAFRIRLAIEAIGSDVFVAIEGSARLSDHDLAEPDIVLTDEPNGEGPIPRGSVTLVVEVSDTSLDFDLGIKAALYAATSIPEYWVADVRGRSITQFWRPSDRAYAKRHTMPFGEPIVSATIEGLTVPTNTL